MRILILTLSVALSSSVLLTQASVVPSEIRVNNGAAEWEIYNDAWLVKREDNDHITYKRRPSGSETEQLPVTTTEKPCTTPIPTTEAPTTTTTTQRPRVTSSIIHRRGLQPKSLPTQQTEVAPGGNYWWMVSHRTDNRITYTRRSNSTTETTTEKANAGQLRRLGHGQDSVVARVVNVGGDDLLTEENVLSRGRLAQPYTGRKSTKSRISQPAATTTQATQTNEEKEGYPRIGEEHNGWLVVGKTKDQISWERVKTEGELELAADHSSNLQSGSAQGEQTGLEESQQYISHNINDDDDVDGEEDSPPRVGDVENGWRVIKKRKNHITWEKVEAGGASLISRTLTSGQNQLKSGTEQSQTQTSSQFHVHEVESYPRVNDIVEGWRVVSKSNEHISWAKVGTENETNSQLNQKRPSNLQLRSGDRVHYRTPEGAERVFPRTRGGAASGEFPNEFETYSRSTNPNFPSETVVGGTVRTSNSTSWNIGDELHGWKVIGKDYRGIIWEKIKNETETTPAPTQRPRLQVKSGDNLRRRGNNSRATGLNQVQNGDFVRYLHPDGQERLYPKSRDSDVNNLQINNNLEGSNIQTTQNSTTSTDPKRIGWYLAKERRNLITWQKDDVEQNAVYNHNDFPQIGHEQSGWKVSNKTRHHISWRRVGTDDLESDEEIPSR